MSTPLLGHPALRRLAVLKLRAVFRRALRRVRRPSGALFALVGLLLMGGWVAILVTGAREREQAPLDPETLTALTRGGLVLLGVVTVLSALSAKGLYMPREDLERLLSGPVSRADLVRYRMQVDLGRSGFGALVFALLVLGHMPEPVFAFFGVVIAMLTLSVVRTGAALYVGAASTRFQGFLGERQVLVSRILVGVLVWFFLMLLLMGDTFLPEQLEGVKPLELVTRVLDSPLARGLLVPLEPWARAVTATSWAEFATAGGIAALGYVVLFELVARFPIDYREVSIETSLDVTRRVASMRKAGGPFGMALSKGAGEQSIPWLLGKSPFGAIAWIQIASIRRKARGTIFVSAAVVGLVTFVATIAMRGEELHQILGGAAIIALGGTVYLCSGLRFDFRANLDRMEVIKAWPLPPWRIFLATILPEVLLASALLSAAILVRAAVTGEFHPLLLGVIGVLPLLTLTWVALDNAVFLFAPVRFIPGQEGALHHMGRTMLLVLLRIVLFGIVGALTGAVVLVLAFFGGQLLNLSEDVVTVLAAVSGLIALVLLDAALLATGGWLLRRFDVSRDYA